MIEIHPLLDSEKQRQARQYEKEKRILGIIGMLFSFAGVSGFYFSGLSQWLSQLFPEHSVIWTFLVYSVVFQAVLFAVGFPMSFISGYRHEHKWNFSNQTFQSWLWEQTKSLIIGLTILTVLLGLLFWIMAAQPQNWWWIAGLATAVVSVFFATLGPVVILPIFNKYTPIKEQELTDSLEIILKDGGLNSSGFFMEDMSRQTKKENAFLAGLGKTRRVVLGDNLMRNMSVPEIESIIAHEVGHFKHKHIWKQIGAGTSKQLFVFFLVDLLMRSVFPSFLDSTRTNLSLFPFLALIMGGISVFIFSPLDNGLSRYFERQADLYALRGISNPHAFSTALAGLADRNLSNAYPERWMKFLYYSHPPIGERLLMADNLDGS
ncbi:MAG: M48 family metallopeptidase [Candidatus Aminicenantes bacterium]|nr:M48 family metallopeptidase [Candidatus Aminicenantes bacterium]